MFTTITMNHMRAIKAWADAHQAQASLDIASFVLEVKARNRYYRLFPQFLTDVHGRMAHVTEMAPRTTAFIGWRPYAPRQLSLSSDKLVFKQALAQAGLATPAHWLSQEDADADHVLKRSSGSFGYQLAGPFRKGQSVPVERLPVALTGRDARGTLYAEAFVAGRNLKVWFWGNRPVHTQCQSYACIQGDGVQTVQALVEQRVSEGGHLWASYKERGAVISSLAFQGLTLDACLASGQTAWLDYRYGRRFSLEATTESEDNAWTRLKEATHSQIDQAGQWLANVVQAECRAPMLCAMDGVLDDAGKVWWLEVNSNPICPPTAYFAMLGSLFGTPAQAPSHAFASVAVAQRPASRWPIAASEVSTKTLSNLIPVAHGHL